MNNLISENGITFETMKNIISVLERSGAGQVVKGHYVAVSSIAFFWQLDFVLQFWDGDGFSVDNLDRQNSNLKVAYSLIDSFQ